MFFFFNYTATSEIYTLSLHDALPIFVRPLTRDPGVDRGRLGAQDDVRHVHDGSRVGDADAHDLGAEPLEDARRRSEEHTSELQSQSNLVCRLLLEKKNILNPVSYATR